MKQLTDRKKQKDGQLPGRAVAWFCCLAAAWMWGCTVADVDNGPDIPAGERLQVEIPVGEVPLQKVEPIDTKAVPDTTEQTSLTPEGVTPSSTEGVRPPSTEGVRPPSIEGMRPPSTEGVTSPSLEGVTRAGTTYKRAIVLQYAADGNTLLNVGSTNIDTYTIGASISAQLVAATNCKIYVYVVNETTTSGSDAAFSTEAKLKAATYDLYGKFAAPTAADVPLIGSLTGIDVVRLASGSGNPGVIRNPTDANSKVMLSRIAAELNITFSYNVPGFQITPATAMLQNLPKVFYLFDPSGTVFPAEASASAFESVSFALTSFDGDKTNETATKLVRFVPTNRRGSNSAIAYPKDKWSGTAPGARCSYLTFIATNKANTAHKLAYSFYFGGNNMANFDLLRNHIYTMNSIILQRSEGDNRIVEAGLKPLVATEPTVESVGTDRATIKGMVMDKHGVPITSYGFYYKKGVFANPANPAADGVKAGEKSGDAAVGTPFSYTLTGLTTNTAYSFCAYAVSANGTSYGEPFVFGTSVAGLPSLGTQSQLVSAANGRSASSSGNTITGTVLSNGVVYSTSTGFDFLTSGTRAPGNPSTGSPYAVTVSNLTPGTTYYYRYFASSAAGFVYGNAQQSVRTYDILTVPTAAAVTSTEVNTLRFTATTAKKDAADPAPTTTVVKIWFDDPGSNMDVAPVNVLYVSPTKVGEKVVDWRGMGADQKYWYASCATNSVGSGYSVKQSFTVSDFLSPGTPSVTTLGPQATTGITLATTGRNTTGVASNGATITSGNNTASKTISIADYTTAGTSRTLTIALTTIGELPLRTATATLTQYGVVFPASFANISNVAYSGVAAAYVPVTANISWTALSDVPWCVIAGVPQTGANTQTGDAKTLTYVIGANPGGTSRTATVTVNGTGSWTSFSRTFTISQAAATLSIDKTNVTAGPQAVSPLHTLTVTSNTAWSVKSSNTGVATVNSSSSTSGNGTRTISTVNNTTAGGSRAATIKVTPTHGTDASYTITQYGVAFPASFANVSNIVKGGQSATNVPVLANIPWKATSNQSWCTIGNASQTGANTQTGSTLNFTYAVAKNTGAARTATITVAGTGSWTSFSRSFTVAQLPGGQIAVRPIDPNTDNGNGDIVFDLFPILDLSDEPWYMLLTSAEAAARRTEMNAQTPSNSATLGVGIGVSDVDGAWNASMSPRFQVMRANLGTTYTWADAYNACKNYSGEGGAAGQWRLPTEKEYKKIYSKQREYLVNNRGFIEFDYDTYWSCTEYDKGGGGAWYAHRDYGTSYGSNNKGNNNKVRCIRDL